MGRRAVQTRLGAARPRDSTTHTGRRETLFGFIGRAVQQASTSLTPSAVRLGSTHTLCTMPGQRTAMGLPGPAFGAARPCCYRVGFDAKDRHELPDSSTKRASA